MLSGGAFMETKTKKKVFNIIIDVLGGLAAIATIIEVCFGDSLIINYLSGNHKVNVSTISLASAEEYYSSKEYDITEAIYTTPQLLDDPIALNNMGYLYSSKLSTFSQDLEDTFELASSYYMASFNKGNETALSNWIILNIEKASTYENLIAALRFGYLHKDIATLKFLAYLITGETVEEQRKYYDKICSKFPSMLDEELIDLINKNTYTNTEIIQYPVYGLKKNDFTTYKMITETEQVVGQYIHNEDGQKVIDPINSNVKIANKISKRILTGYNLNEEFIIQ